MRKEIREEWARLNPVFVHPEDSVFQTIRHAVKETLHGFFAPLFLFVWVVKLAGRRLKAFASGMI